MKSVEGNFDNSEVDKLLRKHFIELRSVSPAGSTHVLDIDGLKDPSIKFWSLWENEKLTGCGALKFLDENHGEFKSIRVADQYRGNGYGVKLWKHVIDNLCDISCLGIEAAPDRISDYKSWGFEPSSITTRWMINKDNSFLINNKYKSLPEKELLFKL